MLEDGAADVDRRDHVGRTPLQFAIMAKAEDIASDLVDSGSRMTARLVDGRTCLHIAAQTNQLAVVRKLLARSAFNAEQVQKVKERTEDADSDPERPSSEDDWSSEDDGAMKKPPPVHAKASEDSGDIPEDETDIRDVFDVNAPDWDLAFTPLAHVVVGADPPVVEELLAAGADVKLVTTASHYDAPPFHPLTLTILTEDIDNACKIADRLIAAGASSSTTTDDNARTIFHRAVASGNTGLVSTLLGADTNSKAAVNFPSLTHGSAVYPIVAALRKSNYSMLALLLAHGAQIVPPVEEVSRAHAAWYVQVYDIGKNSLLIGNSKYPFGYGTNESSMIFTPLETAMALQDESVHFLTALEADVNKEIKSALSGRVKLTLLDAVRESLKIVSTSIGRLEPEENKKDGDGTDIIPTTSWKDYYKGLERAVKKSTATRTKTTLLDNRQHKEVDLRNLYEARDYLARVESLLVSLQAKSWIELHPEDKVPHPSDYPRASHADSSDEGDHYWYLQSYLCVPEHMKTQYDELFEASFRGDNETIQKLCLPESQSDPKPPLQIAVRLTTGRYAIDGKVPPSPPSISYSP